MRTYLITLRVPSGFITPWHADTIFGHLCWTAERNDGFQHFSSASDLIDLYRHDEPPFILSDGFPAGLLPAPVTLKNLYSRTEDDKIDLKKYDLMKRAKKAEYITKDEFLSFLKGEAPELSDVGSTKGFISSTVLHNTISRFTNTTGNQGGLYETEEKYAPNSEIQIYIKIKNGFEDDVRLLFEMLAQSSYGAKKSIGKGALSIKSFEPYDTFDEICANAKISGFVTLSHFVPAVDNPVNGAYKTMIKYGKLGEEKTFCGQPFKKPLIMLQPGSVFYTDSIRPYYGTMLGNISEADSSVVQYAYAFAVPVIA